MSDLSTLQTLRDAAKTAYLAGDYATALDNAGAALLMLGTMPNMTETHASDSREVAWRRGDIEAFIKLCNARQAAASVKADGIRRTKVTYARPTE